MALLGMLGILLGMAAVAFVVFCFLEWLEDERPEWDHTVVFHLVLWGGGAVVAVLVGVFG